MSRSGNATVGGVMGGVYPGHKLNSGGEYKMSRKPEEGRQGAKPAQSKDQSHKPAKHIEETARLASSVEPDKNPEKVRKAGKIRTGGG
jgi:hypothetical protein